MPQLVIIVDSEFILKLVFLLLALNVLLLRDQSGTSFRLYLFLLQLHRQSLFVFGSVKRDLTLRVRISKVCSYGPILVQSLFHRKLLEVALPCSVDTFHFFLAIHLIHGFLREILELNVYLLIRKRFLTMNKGLKFLR